jgi:hypothetical protein
LPGRFSVSVPFSVWPLRPVWLKFGGHRVDRLEVRAHLSASGEAACAETAEG